MADDPRDNNPDGVPPCSPDDITTPMGAEHFTGQHRRTPSALTIGDLLAGRYRVLRFIGNGGMGEVYEAEDCELHERVALKTILPEVARQPESIQRFKREIQLARKVTHPNVCRIYDLVYHGTTIFLTMEMLEGETLAQRLLRTGAMTTEAAFPLVAQMAAGLAAAHRAGIVHRDLKCSNVMLVPAKARDAGVRAVIMDFGLARRNAVGDDPAGLHSTTQAITGTPAYMAPEQVEGREVTSAADIYALGIVMYEMVTGRSPFEGDTPLSIAVKRLQEPPPSPRSHQPGLDLRWERTILRCLERNPADRFADAEEITRTIEPQAPAVEPAEQPRMLEAAAPKRAAVGRSMQMLAMIRRLESPGLKPFVDIEENAPLTQEDIRAKPFRLEFPSDRRGAPQPAEITLRLDSPDFEPKSQVKKLMVPPDRDSEVCTFLLTPKVGGELLLNLEVLKGEVLVASRAIRTVAEITEQQMAAGQNVLVSIPLEVIAYSLRATAGGVFTQLLASPPAEGKTSGVPPVPVAISPAASSPQPTSQASPAEFTRMPMPPPLPPAPMSSAPRDYGMVSRPPRPMAPPPLMPRPAVGSSAPPSLRAPTPMPPLSRPQVPVGALPRARPKSAAWGMWAALMVLLVGVGGGGLLLTRRAPSPQEAPGPMASSAPSPAPPAIPQGSATTSALPAPSPGIAAAPVPPPAVPALPPLSADPNFKAVRAKTNLGDFHLNRGEYDAAIAAYREGLKIDPSNEVLRQKVAKVIRECEEENRVLDEHDKCGAPAATTNSPPAPK